MEHGHFLRGHIAAVVAISDEDFEMVARFFTPVISAKKHHLIGAGERVDREFLVVKGCLKTAAFDEAGKEYIIQFATEGWWVSDYPAYAAQSPAGMFVQALEPSFLLALTKMHRAEMCDLVPVMHVFFERKALAGYAAAQRRTLSLMRDSAAAKYELLLQQYPDLFQRLPQKTIAHYLGVSRETLSRLTKRKIEK